MHFFQLFIITVSFFNFLPIISSQLPTIYPIPRYTCDQALAKTNKVQSEKTSERFGICFTYAITHHLDIIGQAPELLKVSSGVDFIRCLNVLDNYYTRTDIPSQESLVVYQKNPTSEATHFGIVQTVGTTLNECIIKSKWGSNNGIFEHKVFDVPLLYGTHISFFVLRSEFQNNKPFFLSTLQTKITQSFFIKKEIKKHEKLLLMLAQGKNIRHKTNSYFNSLRSIPLKARYLLKTCMGLSINTSDAITKETVLMLTIKRNDIVLAQLFLSMGADQTKKDNNGNTATIIAEQKNFLEASKLLKLYNNNR